MADRAVVLVIIENLTKTSIGAVQTDDGILTSGVGTRSNSYETIQGCHESSPNNKPEDLNKCFTLYCHVIKGTLARIMLDAKDENLDEESMIKKVLAFKRKFLKNLRLTGEGYKVLLETERRCVLEEIFSRHISFDLKQKSEEKATSLKVH